MRSWRKELNKRLAERIFLDAQRDYLTGELNRRSAVRLVTYALAAIVLLSPYLVLAAALALAYAGFPNILPLVVAAILAAAGWFLLPPRRRLPEGALTRAELPLTFALVDRVGAALGAPRIDAIAISDAHNAAVGETRKARYLILGATLWESLPAEQRIALIGHELVHLVNQDPTRNGFLGAAMGTLDAWYEMFLPSRIFEPHHADDYAQSSNLIADLIGGLTRSIVELFSAALGRLCFLESQRAEYLADAFSAEVAGAKAPVRLLQQIEMAPQINVEIARLGGRNLPDGIDMIRRLARATVEVPPDKRDQLLREMHETGHAADETHPPSNFRIAFLQTLPKQMPKVVPSDVDFAAIDRELEPHLARIGQRICSALMVQ
ncbi:peptidase M48, Ste24p [Candidatus Rhodobacter oscarellae]|uniref:Peptidase M48, Ste24p n=1 Tax=Candidatus Rhodobacter oscarellae TaxID=1675527 RepID=A0A0J9E6F3_9RHOB|nr:M48 family metallopeptidase [Candidatus Rhodobacter lobularis]KMW58246.1 peptidase M48, Ste24p [Candidatus Rhodobacter lobularis]